MLHTSESDPLLKNAEREFEIRFLRSRGAAFQEFFSELMEAGFGGDFQRVRAHGLHGDLKSDGYLQTTQTVYQVYGPEDLRNLGKLLSKISDDFRGAMIHWDGRIKEWIFVHNSRTGLPAAAIHLLQDLHSEYQSVELQCWSFNELWSLVPRLQREQLFRLFPNLQGGTSEKASTFISKDQKMRYWVCLSQDLRERNRLLQHGNSIRFSLPIRLFDPTKPAPELHSARSQMATKQTPGDDSPKNDRRSFEHLSQYDLTSFGSLLRQRRRIFLEGDAGSGKSTFLRQFARRELLHLRRQCSRYRIRGKTPVIVDLRLVDESHTIEELIYATIQQAGVGLSPSDLRYLQSRGYLTFLLDGLDEVDDDHRIQCIRQIERLVKDSPRCEMVVASRPYPSAMLAFSRVAISPLTNEDIAGACSQAFGSKKGFRARFDGMNPDTFVSQRMSTDLRRLCRWPLTLRLVLEILQREGKPPATLFETYERFLLWRYEWDRATARTSTVGDVAIAGEILATLPTTLDREPLKTDWVNALTAHIAQSEPSLRSQGFNVGGLIDFFLAGGIVNNDFGVIQFSHKSFRDFFAAKHLLRTAGRSGQYPISPDLSVCRFLCGAIADFSGILEDQFNRCEDVEMMLPLLEECKATGRDGGRFQDLYQAYYFARELGIELCYSMYDNREETFIQEIQQVVDTCVGLGEKTTSILRTAASEVLNGVPFPQSSEWFDALVSGLETLGWKGSQLHRNLAAIGFFSYPEAFSIDGSESSSREMAKEANYEALCAYMRALDENNFVAAEKHLEKLEKALRPRVRKRKPLSSPVDQQKLFSADDDTA